MCCTFTVTTTVSCIIRDLCHMSVGVTSNTYSRSVYCTLIVTSTLSYIVRYLCHIRGGHFEHLCNRQYYTFISTSTLTYVLLPTDVCGFSLTLCCRPCAYSLRAVLNQGYQTQLCETLNVPSLIALNAEFFCISLKTLD